MVHYQSIPAATHHANADQDDTVEIKKKSIMVRRIAGAMIILFVGLGVVATHTYSSGSIIIVAKPVVSSTPVAAAALLRSTTTTVTGAGGVDDCCAPATGSWSGLGTDISPFGKPSETCFIHTGCDTSTLMTDSSGCFCWSKSFYDDAGGWSICYPKGYGAAWEEMTDNTFCGTAPCQDFESNVPTC